MKNEAPILVRTPNPVIPADFPEPDVIRVEDAYYMLSTTLHFLPGAVILRSYDLMQWEIAGYVFDSFEGTEEARMTNERSNYGCGMWAGSLSWHKGRFYVSFAAKETCKTYFYSAESVEGPWDRTCIDFYFHHGSLFFDEDDRVYLVFGHRELWIRELLPDLSGLKQGGFARRVPLEGESIWEGTHFCKIRGKYYLFAVNLSEDGLGRKIQYCYHSDSLEGEFLGGPVLDDDMGLRDCSVAQGGIVETNDGHFFAMLMQERGAVGRCPVLVPVKWEGDTPVFEKDGKVPLTAENVSNRPYYRYEPLYTSDDFSYREKDGGWKLKKQWQWNHEANPALWGIQHEGGLCITTGKVCTNVTQAVNTLTQRLFAPRSAVEVTLDASDLNEGDYAGLCVLQGCYGMIAVTRELRRYYLVVLEREATEKNRRSLSADYMPGIVKEKISLATPVVRLRLEAALEKGRDSVIFSYREPLEGGKWRQAGGEHLLYFGRDHLAGSRCGLSIFATKKAGGSALFQDFFYECKL
ncbi:MAG: family 43 glycosylhydrolase [Acetatifactor sp.]